MSTTGSKNKNPPVLKLHFLSKESADAYAQDLGLFDMGFVYEDDSWGNQSYRAWVSHRQRYVNVRLTRRDWTNPVFAGVDVEINCAEKRTSPPYMGTDEVRLSITTDPVNTKTKLLVHLVDAVGYLPAVPYLRAHKIDSLLT